MAVLSIKKDDFKKEVLDYQGVVLVDFYAEWCGPCKIMGPIIDELTDEIKNVKFVKVNVDESPDLSSEYSVFSIPTFVLFKEGKMVNQLVGVVGKDQLLNTLTTLP
jgi:thioredoxin 1